MSALRRELSPEMQAWIDEQAARFTPADIEPAIRIMRQIRRRSHQEKAAAA
ncbi:hypothetical protein [Nocardia asteroides]|uniref:hypothetical protein n=1 Tax=Nocardia asteroides TaxID=1824 RepID=UPI0033EB19E9